MKNEQQTAVIVTGEKAFSTVKAAGLSDRLRAGTARFYLSFDSAEEDGSSSFCDCGFQTISICRYAAGRRAEKNSSGRSEIPEPSEPEDYLHLLLEAFGNHKFKEQVLSALKRRYTRLLLIAAPEDGCSVILPCLIEALQPKATAAASKSFGVKTVQPGISALLLTGPEGQQRETEQLVGQISGKCEDLYILPLLTENSTLSERGRNLLPRLLNFFIGQLCPGASEIGCKPHARDALLKYAEQVRSLYVSGELKFTEDSESFKHLAQVRLGASLDSRLKALKKSAVKIIALSTNFGRDVMLDLSLEERVKDVALLYCALHYNDTLLTGEPPRVECLLPSAFAGVSLTGEPLLSLRKLILRDEARFKQCFSGVKRVIFTGILPEKETQVFLSYLIKLARQCGVRSIEVILSDGYPISDVGRGLKESLRSEYLRFCLAHCDTVIWSEGEARLKRQSDSSASMSELADFYVNLLGELCLICGEK